jgi:hypothetical protein
VSQPGSHIETVPASEPSRRHRALFVGEVGRRLRLLFVVVAVVVGAAVVDGSVGRSGSSNSPAMPAGSATWAMVSASDAESSAWFCVGGSGAGGGALGTLVLTNATARAVSGTVVAAPAGGATRSVRVSVPADGQIGMVPAQVAPGSWVAATVLFDGGGVGVSQVVVGPLGWSSAPCASSTASNWYFAHGSTASGASLSLSLYNPSTTDAVVNITLDSSSAGVVQPPAYQGIAVPGGSLVVENVGDHLTNDPDVAAEISTSSGMVVAAELQSTPQAGGGGGSSLLLGVRSPVSEWDFPQNVDPPGGSMVFHVFNPSGHEASVSVNVELAQGEAEPLSLRVPPHSGSELVAERETRIPTSGPYALEFSAAAGTGIVVDREVSAPAGSAAPQVGQEHGVPGGASRALLPAVIPPGTGAASLVISDVSSRPVKVTVLSIAHRVPLAGLDHRLVQPGRSLIATPQPGSPIGVAPLFVVASGPVAVELDAAPTGAPGAVVVPAFFLG